MPGQLRKLSDKELDRELDAKAEHVTHSYDSIVAEIDRRAARRQANAQFLLSVVSAAIAVGAIVVSTLRPPADAVSIATRHPGRH